MSTRDSSTSLALSTNLVARNSRPQSNSFSLSSTVSLPMLPSVEVCPILRVVSFGVCWKREEARPLNARAYSLQKGGCHPPKHALYRCTRSTASLQGYPFRVSHEMLAREGDPVKTS